MVLAFYYAMFILSLINFFIVISMMRHQRGASYILMSVTIVITNAGYLAAIQAKTLSEAIVGAKIACAGGAVLPMFVFLGISYLCHFRIPNKYIYAQYIFSFILICCIMTIGYNELYYADVSMEIIDNVAYLYRSYGPLHTLYVLMFIGYAIAMVALIICALFYQKKVSYKTTIMLSAIVLLNMGVYAIERIFNMKMEWQPLALVISEYIVVFLLRRIGIYDVSSSVMNSLDRNEQYGYIVFDKKMNYINSNNTAKMYFTELSECRLDCPVQKKFSFLYDNIIMSIRSFDKNEVFNEFYVACNDKKLKCTIRNIYQDDDNKKPAGYIIEVTDDTKQQEYISLLQRYNKELEEEVDVQHEMIKDLQQQMVVGMAELVEGRDNNTGGHIKRTSGCMQIFADELRKRKTFDKPDWFWDYIVKVSPMHDLGKITSADNILLKPGEFTSSEYEEMKMHAENGALIVEKILGNTSNREFVDIARNIANYHHEKWDGTGYPEGLKGEEIPLEARAMALVDVLDALVSKRSYKEAYEFDKAFKIIEESIGKTFDPVLGEVFVGCKNDLEEFYRSANEY